MNQRDWSFLTDYDYGNPLADIQDWMLWPYSESDIRKQKENHGRHVDGKDKEMVNGKI